MKSKTGISLMLALLMVLSTFTVVDAIQVYDGEDPLWVPIAVNKKVWNGTDWAETVTSYYGEIVTFNITITYHKNCEDGLCATDIQAIDTLPSFLDYTGNANYEHSFVNGNLVQWDLTDDY